MVKVKSLKSQPGNFGSVILPTVVHNYPHTVCPRSLDPIHLLTCFIKWAKTSWTDSTL